MLKANSVPIEKLLAELAERERTLESDRHLLARKAEAARRPVVSELQRRAQARAQAAAQAVIL